MTKRQSLPKPDYELDVFNDNAYSAKEAATALHTNVATVLAWIGHGFFPNAYKNGPFVASPWRIPKRDINVVKIALVRQGGQVPDGNAKEQAAAFRDLINRVQQDREPIPS